MSEKLVLSCSDSDDESVPVAKQPRLAKPRQKRPGKGAMERRNEKNRERMNQKAYEQLFAQCRDPENLFARTTDLNALEAKYNRWDELLKGGGTIFDDNEVVGPILIETEALSEPARDKHLLFMQGKDEGIVEVTYFNLQSDESDDSDVQMEDAPQYVVEQVPYTHTVMEKCVLLPAIDLGNIPEVTRSVDLGALKSEDRYGDINTGDLYKAKTITSLRPVQRLLDPPSLSQMELDEPPVNVMFRGESYSVSRYADEAAGDQPGTPELGPTCSFQPDQEETFEVEVYRRIEETVIMWHCSGVRRVLFSTRAQEKIQYHPLTRKELFSDWDVVMCIYHANSLGDYVRDVVQVYRDPDALSRDDV
uniref:Putative capsid protein n=1 Tax=Atrato Partiti-like virus 3 TaxID=2689328 RepID=A0A6B9KGF1_9VIRU|nr:putative capsid protein [Atrato Partiti-like virus 3]